jgi:Domain of unknown function (DUF3943)
MRTIKLGSLIFLTTLLLVTDLLKAQMYFPDYKSLLSFNSLQWNQIGTNKFRESSVFYPGQWRIENTDTLFRTMSNRLTTDDPDYNKRRPLYAPILGLVRVNVVTWLYDRYVINADYARISLTSWKNNIKYGWVWDNDRFAMNFVFHPIAGGSYYNCGRANGYNFYASTSFAFAGSLMWEYFGENTSPSIDDIINTTGNSMLIGEIMYRLSSNILDDRTTGAERVFREIFAGIIDPVRGINRLLQGKSFRITTKEIYQKEPLTLALYAGEHFVNNGTEFLGGRSGQILGVHLNYGDPFVVRSRKPFDVFRVQAEIGNGDSRKWLNILRGYGLLFGKTIKSGKMDMLIGAYQNYNYFDNRLFEIYSLSFGGGAMTRCMFTRNVNLYTNCYLGLVPFSGNSTQLGPQLTQVRDYNYTGGLETMIEGKLNINDRVNLDFTGYYYWLHTYVGTSGNNYVGLLKPSVSFRIYRNLNLGFEQTLYLSNRSGSFSESVEMRNTEQRISLMYCF